MDNQSIIKLEGPNKQEFLHQIQVHNIKQRKVKAHTDRWIAYLGLIKYGYERPLTVLP